MSGYYSSVNYLKIVWLLTGMYKVLRYLKFLFVRYCTPINRWICLRLRVVRLGSSCSCVDVVDDDTGVTTGGTYLSHAHQHGQPSLWVQLWPIYLVRYPTAPSFFSAVLAKQHPRHMVGVPNDEYMESLTLNLSPCFSNSLRISVTTLYYPSGFFFNSNLRMVPCSSEDTSTEMVTSP